MGQSKLTQIDKFELPWSDYIPVKPLPKQLAFLLLPTLEALYGGAAGGGKSIALLMGALQYVDIAGYAALILRRTYADLTLPGALIDMASEWLIGTDAEWSELKKTWTFPSGATLTFGYLQHTSDRDRYYSSRFHYIGVDELTQFPEGDYRYMFARLRRAKESTIPIRMRAASNPGNIGHDWVKQRFMIEPGESRIFLPATLDDNEYLDISEYKKALDELDPITRQQLLNGDWTARHGGNKFLREWFEIVDVAPADCQKVRRWDLAGTEAKKGKDPDWTAGCLLGKSKDNTLYLIDMVHKRGTPNQIEQLIKQTAELDSKSARVTMEQEPGSSGIKVIDDYRRRILFGWDFRGIPSTGSKELRANPVASQAEAGNIKLVRGKWINAFLDEAELFPNGSHDDQIDALSGALADLSSTGWRPR